MLRFGQPSRIAGLGDAMTTAQTKLLTAADLLRLHSEGVRGELIQGVLSETMSTGEEHGEVASIVISTLMEFVRPRRLGRVIGTDSGILLERDPDTVREPDVAFISADKLPHGVRLTGYYEGAPDLVVEIVSPSDRPEHVYNKACMWILFGVRLVWVLNPDDRTVDVHKLGDPTTRLTEDDTLDGGDVLPGFSCAVRDLFDL